MMKHRVHLTEEEREELKGLVSKGGEAAYRQTRARILLLCDENQDGGAMRDADIARALKVGSATVERVRRRCVEEGLARALGRKEQVNRRPRKLAESELAVLAGQCPARRIPGRSVLKHETGAWEEQRNRDGIRAAWRFTTQDARIKLKSLYPSIQR